MGPATISPSAAPRATTAGRNGLVTQDGEQLGSAYNIEAEQYVELDGKTYAYGDLTQEQLEQGRERVHRYYGGTQALVHQRQSTVRPV